MLGRTCMTAVGRCFARLRYSNSRTRRMRCSQQLAGVSARSRALAMRHRAPDALAVGRCGATTSQEGGGVRVSQNDELQGVMTDSDKMRRRPRCSPAGDHNLNPRFTHVQRLSHLLEFRHVVVQHIRHRDRPPSHHGCKAWRRDESCQFDGAEMRM